MKIEDWKIEDWIDGGAVEDGMTNEDSWAAEGLILKDDGRLLAVPPAIALHKILSKKRFFTFFSRNEWVRRLGNKAIRRSVEGWKVEDGGGGWMADGGPPEKVDIRF